jgi:hypothetical protein
MGASILTLAMIAWPTIADLKGDLLEQLPRSSRPEAGGLIGDAGLWSLVKANSVRQVEWREYVGRSIDAEEAKVECGTEIWKVLLKNARGSQALRNPPIHHTGFYDPETAKTQERIARAKARIEFERDLFPWQEFISARPWFLSVLFNDFGAFPSYDHD